MTWYVAENFSNVLIIMAVSEFELPNPNDLTSILVVFPAKTKLTYVWKNSGKRLKNILIVFRAKNATYIKVWKNSGKRLMNIPEGVNE